MQKFVTFLMFENQAQAALDLYCSVFPDSKINNVIHNADGTIMHATFILAGQQFMAIDGGSQHGFTFTPAMSVYVNCASDAEINSLYEALSAGGKVMMALGAYPFSPKYGWVSDRFGVSWQLNLSA